MTNKGMDIKGLATALKNKAKEPIQPNPIENEIPELNTKQGALNSESTIIEEKGDDKSPLEEEINKATAIPNAGSDKVESSTKGDPAQKTKKGSGKGKAPFASSLQIEDIDQFLTQVKNWQRPTSDARSNIVLDESLLHFFGKAKVATKIPAVQLVNYIVTYFLKCNPDFVDFINKEREGHSLEDAFKDL